MRTLATVVLILFASGCATLKTATYDGRTYVFENRKAYDVLQEATDVHIAQYRKNNIEPPGNLFEIYASNADNDKDGIITLKEAERRKAGNPDSD